MVLGCNIENVFFFGGSASHRVVTVVLLFTSNSSILTYSPVSYVLLLSFDLKTFNFPFFIRQIAIHIQNSHEFFFFSFDRSQLLHYSLAIHTFPLSQVQLEKWRKGWRRGTNKFNSQQKEIHKKGRIIVCALFGWISLFVCRGQRHCKHFEETQRRTDSFVELVKI